MSTPPQALLFDLRGVLFEFDFGRALQAWSGHSALSLAELRARFTFDAAYERHERGEIGAGEYFAHLASVLGLSATPQQIETGWNAIFIREIGETRALVQAARRRLPCYAFTNTNASHMTAWSAQFPGVVAGFDRIFASHEIGLRKPERAAFDHICRALALPPQSILFFDDLPENVQGALDAGLRGVCVRSPADVARALREHGVH
jgi:putative hydrolase of the HAD superfamily